MMDKADSLDTIEKHIRQTTTTTKPFLELTPPRPPKIYEGQDISECLANGETQVPGQGNKFPKLYNG